MVLPQCEDSRAVWEKDADGLWLVVSLDWKPYTPDLRVSFTDENELAGVLEEPVSSADGMSVRFRACADIVFTDEPAGTTDTKRSFSYIEGIVTYGLRRRQCLLFK